MAITDKDVLAALSELIDPVTGRNYVEARCVKNVKVEAGSVSLDVVLGYPGRGVLDQVRAQVAGRLKELPGVTAASVNVASKIVSHAVQRGVKLVPGIKNIIAVASGKGGVGKSTTAANLALALQAEGAKVGILDADIYGPSQPRMMGVSGKPDSLDGKHIEPKIAHGVQVMSIGLLVEEDTPMIWRGPMVTQALTQLLSDTRWQDLDYLVIDLPPGTGDIQLTLCQKVPVSGAVIVTTPQDIALLDAKKALKMFEKVNVPVLGIVENMAIHVCSQCGHAEHIFGEGGGASMSAQYGVPLLGSLPLDIHIREQADGGTPTVVAMPDSDAAHRYRTIARNTAARLSLQPRNKKIGIPNLVVQGA